MSPFCTYTLRKYPKMHKNDQSTPMGQILARVINIEQLFSKISYDIFFKTRLMESLACPR